MRGSAFAALGDDASSRACHESASSCAAEQGLFMQQVGRPRATLPGVASTVGNREFRSLVSKPAAWQALESTLDDQSDSE